MMMRKTPKFCVIFCDDEKKIHTKYERAMTMRTAEQSIAEPLLASFLVSLVSLVACAIAPILTRLSSLASVSSSSKKSNARAMALFGSGALLADACTHGIPNSFGKLDGGGGEFAGGCFLSGVLTFYALDCFIRARVRAKSLASEDDDGVAKRRRKRRTRGGQKEEEDGSGKNHPGHTRWQNIASGGWLNLFADGLHNFTDGVALAMSFKKGGRKAGLATATALATHELPQEIGDYGVLRNCGFSHGHALGFNFLSATLSIVGTVFAWYVGKMSEKWEVGLEAFCAAGFVFVSISQMVTVSVEEEEEEEEEEGKHRDKGNKRPYARDMMSVLLGVLVVYQVHAVFGCCGGHEEEGHHHHHHHHDEH